MKIQNIIAREIFDSRGNPTVECELTIEGSPLSFRGMVPSGASTGKFEALELRDGDKNRMGGKGVLTAVSNVNDLIKPNALSKEFTNYQDFDEFLINLDGTENKSKIGANAILAVSIANLKSAAKSSKQEIYQYINNKTSEFFIPYPLMNIINGGVHANNSIEIQEFMIRPDGAKNFQQCMQMAFLVIKNLNFFLNDMKMSTSVGDEGGFAPSLNSDEEAIEIIIKSINAAGFEPGKDISICLDVAANELKKPKTVDYYLELIKKYPIKSIEDPFSEDNWEYWKKLSQKTNVQIVGDDLFVTNKKRLKKGITEKSANAILIKPNQIGTVSETIETIKLAHENEIKTIISHRSGDSEDTFISDLAVATNSSQIKSGSLARSERVAKYNRLLRIEEALGNSCKMAKI